MTGNRQAFSTEEFRARVRRVHAAMEKQGIDLLLIHAPENIYYLTGYQTSGYFAYQVGAGRARARSRSCSCASWSAATSTNIPGWITPRPGRKATTWSR